MAGNTPPFDPTKKRPLELRVRDLGDVGGISDLACRSKGGNRVAADAIFLIRILLNDDTSFAMEVMSLVGETRERMKTSELFDMWVRMAAYIIRDSMPSQANEVAELEDMRQRRFCLAVLRKLFDEKDLRSMVAGLPEAASEALGLLTVDPTLLTERPPASSMPQSDGQVASRD